MEGYHRRLESAEAHNADTTDGAPATIHEITRAKEPGLEEKIATDRCLRRSLVDRFLALGTTLEDLKQSTYQEEGDFLGARYHVESIGIDEDGDCDFEILMTRAGHITRDGKQWPLWVEKRITIPADSAELRTSYRLRNPGPEALELLFCPEFNFNLLSPDDAQRSYQFAGLSGAGPRMHTTGSLSDCRWIALVDHYQHFRLALEMDPPATVWRHPVETVSQSEGGFESIHQGCAIAPQWKITLAPGEDRSFAIHLQVKPTLEKEPPSP